MENSVSLYPALEGRFPQVAGMRFAFDPTRPPGQRVEARFVTIGDQYLQVLIRIGTLEYWGSLIARERSRVFQMEQNYTLVTKEYLYNGRDGYGILQKCRVLVSPFSVILDFWYFIAPSMEKWEKNDLFDNQKHDRIRR